MSEVPLWYKSGIGPRSQSWQLGELVEGVGCEDRVRTGPPRERT